MKSKRIDGRGHKPAGLRNNRDVAPPVGYVSIDQWLAEIRKWCADGTVGRGHTGRQAELARRLKVHRSTLANWLNGKKWPIKSRARQLHRSWTALRSRADL